MRRCSKTAASRQNKQCEDQADDKCAEEKIPEENDFLAFHAAIIYFSDARSITNR
jgi:hypothetical protein